VLGLLIATQPVHWHTGYCLAMAVVLLFVLQSLPSNGFMLHNILKYKYIIVENHFMNQLTSGMVWYGMVLWGGFPHAL
jgi:hypothetical protein